MNKKTKLILMAALFVSAISVVSLLGRHILHSNQNKENIENVEISKDELELMSTKFAYAGVNTVFGTYLSNSVVEKQNINSTGTSINDNIDIEDRDELIKSKKIGWASTDIYVFTEPSLDSLSLGVIEEDSRLVYTIYNEEWVIVKYNKEDVFIQSHLILDEKLNYKIVTVPEYEPYTGFKTWMPYTAIRSVSSRQYKLQQMCYTGDYGIRMYEGRYCIAVGTSVTSSTGTYIDVILENGTVIECIVGDIKADIHTESMNIFTMGSNCCSEFVIDYNALHHTAKIMGNMSYCCEEWNSKVVAFKVYNINIFETQTN